ncbi:hypothetical protein QBC41DRAFT_287765 [Cercophora samala]|uniref:AB hydrolase-1 domain-containing protein n=1 Tax=Cercophora samala TaxID=330535 RepID=A0AA39YT27_9PEZI|nr:hypothetical protein QBC41DRAFT_287765 [Cercophora samala]
MTCRISLLFGALFFALPSTAIEKTTPRVPPLLAPNCRNVQIPLGNITAANIDFRGLLDEVDMHSPQEVTEIFSSCLDPHLFIDPYDYDIIQPIVERNVTIHGILCQPETPVAVQNRQIHLLVHDISYDKSMWHGLGVPEYSLADALASGLSGSYTLAIDLWGHGDSHGPTYPDPWQVLQPPFHVEVLHELAVRLRTNQKGLWSAFKNITYVGHGFGAQLGSLLLDDHPSDADTFVGTGFPAGSKMFPRPSEWMFVPALSTDPKYQDQPLGYFAGALTSFPGRRNILYGGSYEDELAELDFVSQDTITGGEACWGGSYLAMETVPMGSHFKGQTCILAGEYDRVSCADAPETDQAPECKDKLRAICNVGFPNASSCTINVLGVTGRAWMLHNMGIKAANIVRKHTAQPRSWGNLCSLMY